MANQTRWPHRVRGQRTQWPSLAWSRARRTPNGRTRFRQNSPLNLRTTKSKNLAKTSFLVVNAGW
jgi:hypothetical protein